MNPTYRCVDQIPCGTTILFDAEGTEWHRSTDHSTWQPTTGWPDALSLAELVAAHGPVTTG